MIVRREHRGGGHVRVTVAVSCESDGCTRRLRPRQWAGTCLPQRVELAARQDAALAALNAGWAYVDGLWSCQSCATWEPCAGEAVAC